MRRRIMRGGWRRGDRLKERGCSIGFQNMFSGVDDNFGIC
jgi:hypothetical protein